MCVISNVLLIKSPWYMSGRCLLITGSGQLGVVSNSLTSECIASITV